jgi:hypothetical protein
MPIRVMESAVDARFTADACRRLRRWTCVVGAPYSATLDPASVSGGVPWV